MHSEFVALALLGGFHQNPQAVRFQLRGEQLFADRAPLPTLDLESGEVAARIRFLASQIGIPDADPEHLGRTWHAALAGDKARTRSELLALARSPERSDEIDVLARWSTAFRHRLAPTLEAVPWVDAFALDASRDERASRLELEPFLVRWPRRLLEERSWAFIEAPLPRMDPLPLDEIWVDLDIVDFVTASSLPEEGALTERLDRLYETRRWRTESVEFLLDRLSGSAALIGPPGSGKTTLLKWLARRQITHSDQRFVLPLYVSLREYVRWAGDRSEDSGLLDYAIASCGGVADPRQHELWANVLSDLAGKEREHVLFLLDGWDEVPLEHREALLFETDRLLHGFSALITSRPSVYPRSLPTAHFYEVAELAPESVDRLIRQWLTASDDPADEDAAAPTRLLSHLDHHVDLRRMARNPFLLTLLCGLFQEARRDGGLGQLPTHRSEIYRRALRLIYDHHDRKYQEATFDRLRRRHVERLALWLHAEAPGAPRYLFDARDVAEVIEPGFLERYLQPARLLNQWDADSGSHHFLHTTFQEFLAAGAMAREDAGSMEQHIRAHLHDPAWQNVFFFLAAQDGDVRGRFWHHLSLAARHPDRFGLVHTRMARFVAERRVQDGGEELLGLDLREALWEWLESLPLSDLSLLFPFVDAYAALDRPGLIDRLGKAAARFPEKKLRFRRALAQIRGQATSGPLVDTILEPSSNAVDVGTAFEGLHRHLDHEGYRRLRDAARDPRLADTIRQRAILGLGHARDAASIAWLGALARDDLDRLDGVTTLATTVVRALGLMGGDQAVHLLTTLTSWVPSNGRARPREWSDAWRRNVIAALGEIHSRAARDALLKTLALTPLSSPVAETILEKLADKPIHHGRDMLLHILRSESSENVRFHVVLALRQASGFGVVEAIAEVARSSTSPRLRRAGLLALEQRARPVDVQWLVDLVLGDELSIADTQIASKAVLQCAGQFAATDKGSWLTAKALEVLQHSIERDASLGRTALQHAHLAGVAVAPSLLEVARDRELDGRIRAAACEAIGRLRHRPAVDDLLRLIRDTSSSRGGGELVATAAARALAQIDVTALRDEPGERAARALATHAVRFGLLVFDDKVLGPDGQPLSAADPEAGSEPTEARPTGVSERRSTKPVEPSPVTQVSILEIDVATVDRDGEYRVRVSSNEAGGSDERIGPAPRVPTLQTLSEAPRRSAELTHLGTELFDFLFAGRGVQVFRMALGMALGGGDAGARLRIQLTIDAPELTDLPWELVYDPDRERFLAAERRISLIRRLRLMEPVRSLAPQETVRVLGLFPSSAGIDSAVEQAALAQLSGRLDLRVLHDDPPVTVDAIRGALREHKPHVVHFLGHGAHDHEDGAWVWLDDPDGLPLRLDATSFARLVAREERPPSIVVLNACEGALNRAVATPTGVAQALLRHGVIGVVAMQSRIPVSRSAKLSAEIYAALADSATGDFEAAVSRGRSRLLEDHAHSPGFASPVLYLRGNDVEIWPSAIGDAAGRPQRRRRGSSPPSEGSRRPMPDLTRLPVPLGRLEGRGSELQALHQAIERRVTVLSIIGFGGQGKSALCCELVDRLAPDYTGADKVFAWSFYSQGEGSTTGSASAFLEEGLRFWQPSKPVPADEGERVRALARALRSRRFVLILDGVEPLQHPPHVREGRFRDRWLRDLLLILVREPADGLVIVTSRQPLVELERHACHQSLELSRLGRRDGARLLRRHGVRGGQRALGDVVDTVEGHPLTLELLGRLLATDFEGDVGQSPMALSIGLREQQSATDDAYLQSRHVERVFAYYERQWPERSPERRMLDLLGLFDRPMAESELRALIADSSYAAAIPTPRSRLFRKMKTRLQQAGLLAPGNGFDTHPLVRSWYGERFRARAPESFRAAQGILFRHFERVPAEQQPSTREALEPLYRAVSHGCRGGLAQEALGVFQDRIRRGASYWSIFQLGAFDSDISALSAFFPDGWLDPPLPPIDQTERFQLLGDLAYCFSSVGRLHESTSVLEAQLQHAEQVDDEEGLGNVYQQLIEMYAACGRLTDALAMADRAVRRFAEGDTFSRATALSDRAYVSLYLGSLDRARRDFAQAEQILEPWESPMLGYSGFQVSELLLETEAWDDVLAKAVPGLEQARSESGRPLHLSLYELAVGRAWLGLGRRRDGLDCLDRAREEARLCGSQETLAHVLTMASRQYFLHHEVEIAQACFDEAAFLVEDAGMDLLRVDLDLIAARTLQAANELEAAQHKIESARRGIEATGYGLRSSELRSLAF